MTRRSCYKEPRFWIARGRFEPSGWNDARAEETEGAFRRSCTRRGAGATVAMRTGAMKKLPLWTCHAIGFLAATACSSSNPSPSPSAESDAGTQSQSGSSSSPAPSGTSSSSSGGASDGGGTATPAGSSTATPTPTPAPTSTGTPQPTPPPPTGGGSRSGGAGGSSGGGAPTGWSSVVGGGGFFGQTFDNVTWTGRTVASGTLFSVACADNLHGWVSGTNGFVAYTANGGASWATQQSMLGGNLRAIN